jgi:vacuolar-type H+-ATPase subunit I/STV1
MNESGQSSWLRTTILVGLVYLVAGLLFGALAHSAGSQQTRVAWRLAAWAISVAAFAAHIGYEQFRPGNSPRSTALHAALAVALGAFGLAVSASLHAYTTQQRFPASMLVLWPIATGIPAFLVAFAAAVILTRVGRPR